jgi:hypothetical protein
VHNTGKYRHWDMYQVLQYRYKKNILHEEIIYICGINSEMNKSTCRMVFEAVLMQL